MTSEREWSAHDTVSGIAIYQLVADAIAATRWVWNGRKKFLAPVPDSPELRPAPMPATAASPVLVVSGTAATPPSPVADELLLG